MVPRVAALAAHAALLQLPTGWVVCVCTFVLIGSKKEFFDRLSIWVSRDILIALRTVFRPVSAVWCGGDGGAGLGLYRGTRRPAKDGSPAVSRRRAGVT